MLYFLYMVRTTIGVLRGGTSSEYDLSLKTGAAILAALPEEKYDMRDIFVDKRGYWNTRGVPVDPARALSQMDVIVNALHGGVGEDGSVQRILERAGVPYTGARPIAVHQSLNKIRMHEILKNANVRMPHTVAFTLHDALSTGEMTEIVFAEMGPPYLVKPASEGASHGIAFAATIADLPDVLGDVLDSFGAAIVQQYMRGREAAVGVTQAATVAAREAGFFSKLMSFFTGSEKKELMALASLAHHALGLSHFSIADFIVTPHAVFLLEVNAIPALYPGAVFPQMLESVGSSVDEFIEHSIGLARA